MSYGSVNYGFSTVNKNYKVPVSALREDFKGYIGFEPIGDGGFGYDPLFMVGDKSFAQLSPAEKDALSHRGNALRLISEKLKEYMSL
jgi:inosine/xanthosine triphosphate pyrophosphatase family protein